MVDIVAELNKEMPNLSLSINEQTGEINKSEKAVLDYIDALKEQLRFEATRERLTQLYKENSTITTELARAQEKIKRRAGLLRQERWQACGDDGPNVAIAAKSVC